ARLAAFADLDPVARLHLKGGDVRRDAVDGEATVADELASLGARAGGRPPEHDVVEAELERPEERLAGHARSVLGGVEVDPELALEDAVHAADLLLLPELQAVVTDL